jgi:hypothetical protein
MQAKAEGAQFALKDPFLHRISKLKVMCVKA